MLCLATAKLGLHQSFHSNPPRSGDVESSHQHPLSAWNRAAWVPSWGFCPFSSSFVPSLPPPPSPRARLQLPRGSCHLPLPPTAFFCPPKAAAVPAVPHRGFGVLGTGSFPRDPSPPPLTGGVSAERGLVTLFPCLSHLGPSSEDQLGSRWRWLPGGQGGNAPAGRPPSPPLADNKRLRSRGKGGPMAGRAARGAGSRQQPPCRLRDAPHQPRGSSRAPTRRLCGTWKGGSSALTVRGCGNPTAGSQPHAPPSGKQPPTSRRKPLTQAGF